MESSETYRLIDENCVKSLTNALKEIIIKYVEDAKKFVYKSKNATYILHPTSYGKTNKVIADYTEN